ncbi:UDP-N-acetylmuramoyl-tripeptide--D-alanyl-D-alanine ligase [bacterium]|nr:UDP-N-acetylmuramoyl-tripeptide--D-alanyl-D-alanine ligase [bacterium]MDC1038036.1 UDP-N-acetylmuramoyl-tripeptide--D-alanyl-D-alanine ligase [Candidatus Neomarinimicrobiota bacterium]
MRITLPHSEKFSTVFETVTGQKLLHPILGITTDSRDVKEGDLYIALKGERVDGHSFLASVAKNGSSCALVSEPEINLDFQQVQVKDPQEAIGQIANAWRKQFNIPVIGITGSNGKTSTKDLLVHVLKSSYDVHATQGNFNTTIGLPLTLLQLNDEHTVSILEMGASKPGEIQVLCEIAEPTHGIITNIAPAHLEGFGSIETIAREKEALFRSLGKGISFVNQADNRIVGMDIEGESITFGLTPDCDFPADIHQEEDGSLTLILDAHDIPTESQNLSFIKNIIAVSAIAVTLGVEWENVINQIQSFSPPTGRCQVKQYNDVTVIDDTYNANLISSLAALDYLKAFSGNGRRIFVFGDMFELGPTSTDQHRQIGEKCTELGLDGVFTLGENTIHTDSAINNGIQHEHFENKNELIDSLKKLIHSGDKILFKGSRGMAMEKVIQGVFPA